MIGILTFHDGINHGAYLQAYALQNFLKGRGFENEIINYKNIRFTLKEYKVFLVRKNLPIVFRDLLKIMKFKRAHKQLKMTKRIFGKRLLSGLQYDLIVIGSDSVWNYSNELSNFDPVYFSDGLNAKRIVSYAASFGPDSFGDACPDEMPQLLKRFDRISVRDSNSKKMVEEFTVGKDVKVVLDPTFLYDFQQEVMYPDYENYILLYNVLDLTDRQGQTLRSFARKVNRKVISISYKSKWADNNIISVSPFEWLGFFKKADYVVTKMYHGTLFSVKFNKRFCSILSQGRFNKIKDFLDRTGLGNRMIPDDGDFFESVFEQKIDYPKVNSLIDQAKKDSEEYLLSVVNNA